MPNYRRAFQPGGTLFLTLVTHNRVPLFAADAARTTLKRSIVLARNDRPFELFATVLLPDHLHLLIQLPDEDADFSIRVAAIKGRFTRMWLKLGGTEGLQSVSRLRQHHSGIWQKRFWEQQIRDEAELIACYDYIHYNPVKHGLSACPHEWKWSSFHRFVAESRYERNWLCCCQGAKEQQRSKFEAGGEFDA